MYNKIMRRMNERVERYYGNNGSHNYRSREGANIPKGYGAYSPSTLTSVATKEHVQGNLEWMRRKFDGTKSGSYMGVFGLKDECNR